MHELGCSILKKERGDVLFEISLDVLLASTHLVFLFRSDCFVCFLSLGRDELKEMI